MTPENVVEEVKNAAVATPETDNKQSDKPEQNSERRFSRGKEKHNRDRDNKREKPKKEFDELLLEVRRVTRVTTGGRRMSFRATILVGNKKGKIGLGIAKGNDVAGAVSKATNEAYKALFLVPITKGDTVPYALTYKYKASKVRLLPASEGTGLKAGSSIRSVLELAGYSNILSKMIGSNNKLNNALATIKALASYKHADHFSALREIKEPEGSNPTPKKEEKSPEKKSEVKNEEKAPEKKAPVKKAVEKKTPSKKPVAKKEKKAE
ncbi:MAG: 30S ribosomal protein S5 [Candidatus Peribacteria bacterium]|jgi:small subunit ribosomal protein S5|nr:30S ribosomal protein S5 [Candidatus Peribacteria bacterium]